jgi:hypothetical protein
MAEIGSGHPDDPLTQAAFGFTPKAKAPAKPKAKRKPKRK